jgi:hypothetical protein
MVAHQVILRVSVEVGIKAVAIPTIVVALA